MADESISLQSQLVQTGGRVWELRSGAVSKANQKLKPAGRREAYALKRLHRDHLECLANPLATVAAEPVDESNMFIWHGNVKGPPKSYFENTNFHIAIHFPRNYPSDPPKIEMLSGLLHKHVYGEWICLDMLEGWIPHSYDQKKDDRFCGWTSAYTVQAILIQMQSFLFAEGKLSRNGMSQSKRNAERTRCAICRHTNDTPWPPYRFRDDAEDSSDDETDKVGKTDGVAQTGTEEKQEDLTPFVDVPAEVAAVVSAETVEGNSEAPKQKGKRKRRRRKRKSRSRAQNGVTLTSSTSNGGPQSSKNKNGMNGTNSSSSASTNDLSSSISPSNSSTLPKTEAPLPLVDPSVSTNSSLSHQTTTSTVHVVNRQKRRSLRVGSRVLAVIIHIKHYGAFAHFGENFGKTGFIHISQIREGRVVDIHDELQLDQQVECWITEMNSPKGERYNLTMLKNRLPRRRIDTLVKGEKLQGTVLNISDYGYGAFVSIGCDKNAWLDVSEMGNQIVWDVKDALKIGQNITVKVLSVDFKRKVQVQVKLVRKKKPVDLDSKEVDSILSPSYGTVPDEVLALIFGYLSRKYHDKIRGLCPQFARVIEVNLSRDVIRNELCCFHSKLPYTEETLGLGLIIKRYENSGVICEIHPTLDPIGLSAWYNQGQRVGVWKEPFTHWLPLYINKFHGRRAIPRAKEAISLIVYDAAAGRFTWRDALKILTTLMNTMVVDAMSGSVYQSILALQGYCAFYHLLLAFCEIYPKMQIYADQKILEFLRDEFGRNKKSVPSLGEWIIYLTISDTFGWRHAKVARAYLHECFDRNSKWIIIKHNELSNLRRDEAVDKDGKERLEKSLEATEVSRKLLMFHVYFLKALRRNPVDGSVMTAAQVKKKLDLTFGRPTRAMEDELLEACKRIAKVSDWTAFFKWIDVPPPSDHYLIEWLRKSIRNSERKRYHNMYWIRRDAGKLKKPQLWDAKLHENDGYLDQYDYYDE